MYVRVHTFSSLMSFVRAFFTLKETFCVRLVTKMNNSPRGKAQSELQALHSLVHLGTRHATCPP